MLHGLCSVEQEINKVTPCAGFSLHDGKATQAKKFFQLGPGSGKYDLRGQHSAARSLGGLVFQN
jgi:hypothetical protein